MSLLLGPRGLWLGNIFTLVLRLQAGPGSEFSDLFPSQTPRAPLCGHQEKELRDQPGKNRVMGLTGPRGAPL